MIKIKNLSCDINNTKILNKISLKLPRSGLITILGPSGCGKTTFLNCLSGLIDYDGSIKVDNTEIKDLNDDEKSEFRLRNIGFIFQDFKLIEYQTVLDNISLPLRTITNLSNENVIRRTKDLLEIVELDSLENRIVKDLSGGEKQRISIARSVINSPKIILADEPTGSLDSINSFNIMKILKKISRNILIIFVTHDEELAKQFSDKIIRMLDGKILEIVELNNKKSDIEIPYSESRINNKKISLPITYVLKQVFQNITVKKIRSSIGFVFMSLALLGIGLSISFSSAISNNIKRSYARLIETSEINIQKKHNDAPQFRSYLKDDAIELMYRYPVDIKGVGILYHVDFESFFKDEDSFSFVNNLNSYKLDGFSSRSINDFIYFEDIEMPVYPDNVVLENSDEVILGLTINQIRTICYVFGIDMNIQALAGYLMNNTIPFVGEFANTEWEYWDEQSFEIKGFCLTNEPFISSSNEFWNEEVFEERMRFPTNEDYLYHEYPWILNKLTYIKCYNIDNFLLKMHDSKNMNNLVFDLCDKKYFPIKYLNKRPQDIDGLVLYYGNDSYITTKEIQYFKKADNNIENETLFNSGGYVSYPQNLLNGFANKTYFSFDCDLLIETMENNSNILIEENEKELLPKGIIDSDFTKTFENPVKFCSKYDNLVKGREPIDYDEIVISKGLLDQLKDVDLNDDFLYMATVTNEINKDYGIYNREYEINEIKIVGISENEKPRIYHNPYWTIDFYITKVGISAFKLLPNVVSYTFVDENLKNQTIDKLKLSFPQYNIFNPLIDINESIDELCKTISLVVFLISMVSLIISIILLSTIYYLNLQDMRKDIALLRCIGIKKDDSMKYLHCFSITSALISLAIATFELVVTSFIISFSLSKQLFIDFELTMEPLAFIVMFLVSVLLSVFLSVVFGKKVIQINPLECLRS